MKSPLYLYSLQGDNAGDVFSNPVLYYPYFREQYDVTTVTVKREFDAMIAENNGPFVVAGGGLYHTSPGLNDRFGCDGPLESFTSPKIAWGVGRNWNVDQENLPVALWSPFDLVGIRDPIWFGDRHQYVPCASCKHELFDDVLDLPLKRTLGVVDHMWLYKLPETYFPPDMDVDHISMDLRKYSLYQILAFIATSSYVVTSSYHAAYWAQLLGKQVIVQGLLNSKFTYLPRPVHFAGAISKPVQQWMDLNPVPTSSELLLECRQQNDAFFTQCKQLLQ